MRSEYVIVKHNLLEMMEYEVNELLLRWPKFKPVGSVFTSCGQYCQALFLEG